MLIMRTMYRLDNLFRRGFRRGHAAGGRLALSLAAVILLLALAAGCSGDSAQRSADSGTSGGSAAETEPPETVQGTTSREATEEAESTVGAVPPETTESAGAGDRAESAEAGARNEPGGSGTGVESGTGEAAQDSPSQSSRSESGGELLGVTDPGDFVASPEDSGGSGYGADGILGVRFGDHEGYERVVVDLGSGGEPTTGVPNWTLSSPTGDGRLKVRFPSVRNTEVSDGSLEKAGAELLDSFYVVRGADGGMFVDFFAKRAFYYRVIELPDPSRVAIDFKPSGSELAIPLPVRSGNTVLTQPRRGTSVTTPMTVSGYSRNPEASNTILLQGPEGKTLAQETVLSSDWSSTWGYFETSLDFQPFTGEGTLKVGAQSARDGSFQGVELPVEQ